MKKKSLLWQMCGGIISIVCISLILFVFIITLYEYTVAKRNLNQETKNLSEKIAYSLNEYVNQINGTISIFYYELDINKTGALATFLTNNVPDDVTQKIDTKNLLDKYFSQLFFLQKDFVDLYIKMNSGSSYFFSSYTGESYGYNVSASDWYQEALTNKNKTNIDFCDSPAYIIYQKPVIRFTRMIQYGNDNSLDNNIVLRMDFTTKKLDELINNYITNDYTSVTLFDSRGDIVYQLGKDFFIEKNYLKQLYAEDDTVEQNNFGSEYMYAYANTDISDLKVLISTDLTFIHSKTTTYLLIGTIISAIILCFSIFISYLFSKKIYSPIKRLEHGIKTIQTGNFNIELKVNERNELEYLVESFNTMASKIDLLIKEKYEEEIQKKNAQYNFLRAQINPHFIFNTLQIIASLAIVNKVPDIVNVVNNLSKIIRYSIENTSTVITLKEEIGNVTCYLEIQKLRFKKSLNYEIIIDESLHDLPIIPMILQPLVENAINHGLKDKPVNGFIKIEAIATSANVVIQISDNGTGMDEESLNLLRAKVNRSMHNFQKDEVNSNHPNNRSSGYHVGLRNINLRLKIYYGDEYGIKISSKQYEGTIITIILRR